MKGMTYPAIQVANRFIELAKDAGDPIMSVAKLIKLVYIAHGWYLSILDKPLIKGKHGKVQAWRYGPVIPEVYFAFQGQIGNGELTTLGKSFKNDSVGENGKHAEDCISAVLKQYGKHTPSDLTYLTHKPGTPWYKAIEGGLYSEISDEEIKNYYKELLGARQQ